MTLNISLNYVSSATQGRIAGKTTVDRKTARVALLRSEVRHDNGRLLAVGIGTFAVMTARG